MYLYFLIDLMLLFNPTIHDHIFPLYKAKITNIGMQPVFRFKFVGRLIHEKRRQLRKPQFANVSIGNCEKKNIYI